MTSSSPRKFDDILRPIVDSDMDSLFILPLSILPLSSQALTSARLIKNVRLECAIEVFFGPQTGSGQVDVESLPTMLGWSTKSVHPDLKILRRLCLLPSFDVYSLRISLRELGIDINDMQGLKLTVEKENELAEYMLLFTRPLIKAIYTGIDCQIDTYEDMLKLFKDPNVDVARRRLESMAQVLNIEISDIPGFIEDYGDTFLSISYFRQCFDRMEPYIVSCMEALNMARTHFQIKTDYNIIQYLNLIEHRILSISAAIAGGLEVIESRIGSIWEKTSAQDFHSAKTFVEGYHITLGAALCCLTVKMNAFARMFPRPAACGALRIADFMIAEMVPGFEMLRGMDTKHLNLVGGASR